MLTNNGWPLCVGVDIRGVLAGSRRDGLRRGEFATALGAAAGESDQMAGQETGNAIRLTN